MPISLTSERVLITGAGGVLGTALTQKLAAATPAALLAPTRAECDLMDASQVARLWEGFRPTVVFHLAGRVAGVQGNISHAGQAFYDNAVINLNVVEQSRRSGVRKVVAAGTAAIYSDDVPLPMGESDIWRGAPHGSEGPYGHAKRAMLAHLDAYRTQYGLDFAYLICTNLYGANDRFDEQYGHVVPSLIARFHRAVQANAETITVWGDGTPTRDFLYADDAAEGFIVAAEKGSGAYNLASGQVIAIRELVEAVASVAGFRGEVVWDTSKPKGQLRRSYDISGITNLGWTAQTPLKEGLRAVYEWYSRHPESVRR